MYDELRVSSRIVYLTVDSLEQAAKRGSQNDSLAYLMEMKKVMIPPIDSKILLKELSALTSQLVSFEIKSEMNKRRTRSSNGRPQMELLYS
jgi:hypothetical protein